MKVWWKPSATSINSLLQALNYVGNKTRTKRNGSTHGYIVYEIDLWDCGYDDYPALKNSLFSTVKLIKNADIEKYKYSGYGIGFDRHVLVFGVDMQNNIFWFLAKVQRKD